MKSKKQPKQLWLVIVSEETPKDFGKTGSRGMLFESEKQAIDFAGRFLERDKGREHIIIIRLRSDRAIILYTENDKPIVKPKKPTVKPLIRKKIP